MRPLALILCFLLGLSMTAASAKEKPPEKDTLEKKEERLRQEAAAWLTSHTERVSRSGVLSLIKDEQLLNKPFPKVVGILNAGGDVYRVMVLAQNNFDQLVGLDQKTLTISGVVITKPDLGVFLAVDEVHLPPSRPVTRRKRGGL